MQCYPYCYEKISYIDLIFYNAWYKSIKSDKCPHCDSIYKISVYLLFKLVVFLIYGGLLAFIFIGPGRAENRMFVLYILVALNFVLFVTVPFFIKLSENE